jgi:hypothetical protein
MSGVEVAQGRDHAERKAGTVNVGGVEPPLRVLRNKCLPACTLYGQANLFGDIALNPLREYL